MIDPKDTRHTKKTMQYFETKLQSEEKIVAYLPVITGGLTSNKKGVLVLTNRRVVHYMAVWFFSWNSDLKLESIPLDKISSFDAGQDGWFQKIKVYTSGNKIDVTPMTKQPRITAFCDSLRDAMSAKLSAPPLAASNQKSHDMVTDGLAKLADLHKAGALDELEFKAAKAKLLESA